MSQEPVIKTFSFSYFMTMALVISFFPLYFDSLGYSKLQIGSLYSIGPAMGIVSNLVWGLLSDRFQTLKKTILAVLAGQLIMVLLLFRTDVYSILFIIMTGFYFFQTPLNGLNDSQILLHVKSTGKSYAGFRIFGSMGFAFAAVLCGFVLTSMGVSVIAYLTIGSVSLSLLLALFLKDNRAGMKRMELSGVWKVVFSKRFLLFLVLILVMSIAHRSNDGFLALYMKDLGADKDLVGLAWMASAVSEIPVLFYLSKHGHKYKELPLLAVACAVYAIRFFLMSLAQGPGWIIAIQAMHSLSFGIFLVTALRYIQQIVPDEYRATGQAVYNIAWSGAAGLISGFAGGHIYDLWGGVILYRFAAATAVLAGIGFVTTHFLQRNTGDVPITISKGESV
ncbi:MFS transporter [Gorillibacterium sp. sgz5001074]|uniref:MFS transporter n=1 Tax=Gorillibacterium sp. sgz5001074 TaxID=3446695 RepID=UPI003F67B489